MPDVHVSYTDCTRQSSTTTYLDTNCKPSERSSAAGSAEAVETVKRSKRRVRLQPSKKGSAKGKSSKKGSNEKDVSQVDPHIAYIEKQLITNNSPECLFVDGERGTSEGGTIDDVKCDEQFLNNGVDDVAVSPAGVTPPIPGIKVLQIAAELTNNDKRRSDVNHYFHMFGTILALEKFIELPFHAIYNGGYYFLIPLFLCQICAVWPLFMLELTLGQYTSRNMIGIFTTLAPFWSKGIFFSMFFIRFSRLLAVRMDPILLVALFDKLFATFFGKRDYVCMDNVKYCYKEDICPNGQMIDNHCHNHWTHAPAIHYLVYEGRNMVAMNRSRDVIEYPVEKYLDLPWIFSTCVICLFVYLFGLLDLKERAKFCALFLILAISTVILFFCLLPFQNITLNYWLSHSTPSALMETDVWLGAFQWACELLTVGEGTVHFMGSVMPFHCDTFKVAGAVFLANIFLTAFSFVIVTPMINSGEFPLYTYNDYNFLPNLRKLEQRWPLLGWLNIFIHLSFSLLAVNYFYIIVSQFSGFLGRQTTWFTSAYSEIVPPIREHCLKMSSCMIFILLSILVAGYPDVISYMHNTFSNRLIVLVALTQFVLVAYQYGISRFLVNMQTMMRSTKHPLIYAAFKLFVAYISPIFCLILTVLHIVSIPEVLNFGSISIITVIAAIGVPSIALLATVLMRRGSIVSYLRAQQDYGPTNVKERRKANHDEMAARIFK